MQITHNSIMEIEGAMLKFFYSTNLEIEYELENTVSYFIIYIYLSDFEKKNLEKMVIECLKPLNYRYELTWIEEENRFVLKIYSSDITIKNIVERHNFNRPKSNVKGKKNAHKRSKVRS